jgi:hypothetical protein
MVDGELHVGHAHRLEPRLAPPVIVPGRGQREPKHPEALPSDRREQRLFVRKMAVQGGARYPELLPGGSQRQLLDAIELNRPHGLLDEGPPQIAVVILASPLFFRPLSGRTNHLLSS